MALKKSNKIVFHIIILLVIFNISNASILNTRYLPFFMGIFLLAYQAFFQRINFSNKFILLILAWIGINLYATILLSVSFFIPRLILNTVNLLLLPYLLLRIMGSSFWIIFEKWVYRLTLISLPLWLLSNLFPGAFINISPYFEQITSQNFLANENYWTALIFTHASMDNGYGILRNCGFMWEPGSFALMIIWALVYNWLKSDKMVFNNRLWVYIIALVTTFSTAGYFAFLILLLGFYLKKLTFTNIAFMLGSVLLFFTVVYQLEFISGKLNEYNKEFAEDPTGEIGYTGHKVNRFQGGIAAVIRTWKVPSGYGLVSAKDTDDNWYAYGTNGLGSLLEMWGFFLFPVLLFLIYKSLKIISNGRRKNFTVYFFFLAIIIEFFSNPIHRNLIVYLLIMTPLVFQPQSFKDERDTKLIMQNN